MSWRTDKIMNGGYSTYLNGKFHTFLGFDKSLEELKYNVDELVQYAAQLEDKIKELEDEKWKDEQLQKMRLELEEMKTDYYRGFPISQEQKTAIEKWRKEHSDRAHGGNFFHYLYEFVPTELGISGSIICQGCIGRVHKEMEKIEKPLSIHKRISVEKELLRKYDAEFEFQEIC